MYYASNIISPQTGQHWPRGIIVFTVGVSTQLGGEHLTPYSIHINNIVIDYDTCIHIHCNFINKACNCVMLIVYCEFMQAPTFIPIANYQTYHKKTMQN